MNHRIALILGLASSLAIEILIKGPWSHAVWVPALIMLFTDFEKVVSGSGDSNGKTSPPGAPPAAGP